jgi:hypothetical protein
MSIISELAKLLKILEIIVKNINEIIAKNIIFIMLPVPR